MLELACAVCWVSDRIGDLFGWFCCKSWPEHSSTPIYISHQCKTLAALLVCTDSNIKYSHCSLQWSDSYSLCGCTGQHPSLMIPFCWLQLAPLQPFLFPNDKNSKMSLHPLYIFFNDWHFFQSFSIWILQGIFPIALRPQFYMFCTWTFLIFTPPQYKAITRPGKPCLKFRK